jgi:hypothetical protein
MPITTKNITGRLCTMAEGATSTWQSTHTRAHLHMHGASCNRTCVRWCWCYHGVFFTSIALHCAGLGLHFSRTHTTKPRPGGDHGLRRSWLVLGVLAGAAGPYTRSAQDRDPRRHQPENSSLSSYNGFCWF